MKTRRNLLRHVALLSPRDMRDFSSDSRPRRFRDESEKQFVLVTEKFDVPRRQRRLLARRRARAILRGEAVPGL